PNAAAAPTAPKNSLRVVCVALPPANRRKSKSLVSNTQCFSHSLHAHRPYLVASGGLFHFLITGDTMQGFANCVGGGCESLSAAVSWFVGFSSVAHVSGSDFRPAAN